METDSSLHFSVDTSHPSIAISDAGFQYVGDEDLLSFRGSGQQSNMPSPGFDDDDNYSQTSTDTVHRPLKRRKIALWKQLRPSSSKQLNCEGSKLTSTEIPNEPERNNPCALPQSERYGNVPELLDFPMREVELNKARVTERAVLIRETIFGRTPRLENESRQLLSLFDVLQHIVCSREDCRKIFRLINSGVQLTYDSLMNYMVKRTGVDMNCTKACPDGHMSATGRYKT